MLQRLRLVVPAAAALVWAFQRLHHKPPPPSLQPSSDQDDGEEAQVELPSGKGPQLPLALPAPLKAVLLDLTLPMSLASLWLALFHNASVLLFDFHQRLGDRDVRIASWRKLKDGQRRRMLRYTTPLKNPLGPRQAYNTEVLEAVHLGATGFVLRGRCDSEGVPFASAFANHIQWVATPSGAHSCRLLITGECQFHSPVWGPLKGQIDRESIKGMSKAYRTLVHMLERQYGAVETPSSKSSGAGSSTSLGTIPSGKQLTGKVAVGADGTSEGGRAAAEPGRAEGEGANIAALLATPQTNAAAFLVIVMVVVLIWRLAFMQPMLMQAMRGVATAVAQR